MLLKHCAYGNVSLLPELNEYIPHRNITLRIHGVQNFTRMSNDRHKQNLQISKPSFHQRNKKHRARGGWGRGGGGEGSQCIQCPRSCGCRAHCLVSEELQAPSLRVNISNRKDGLKINSVYSSQAISPQRRVGKYGFDEIYHLC